MEKGRATEGQHYPAAEAPGVAIEPPSDDISQNSETLILSYKQENAIMIDQPAKDPGEGRRDQNLGARQIQLVLPNI